MPEAPRSPRAPRLAPPERRRLLLAAATGLLEAGGSDALRMDALARAAGVTRPVVYEHFGDREGLIVALIQEHGAAMQARVGAAVAEADGFEAQIVAGVRAYLASVKGQGAAIRGLVRSAGISPKVEAARAAIWDQGTARWGARYRQEFVLNRADAEALAAFHLHGLWSLSDRWLAGQLSARRVEQLHLAVVRSSLAEVSRGRR